MSIGPGFNNIATSPDRCKIIAANAYSMKRRACFPTIISLDAFELYFAAVFVALQANKFALNSAFKRITTTRLSHFLLTVLLICLVEFSYDNSSNIALKTSNMSRVLKIMYAMTGFGKGIAEMLTKNSGSFLLEFPFSRRRAKLWTFGEYFSCLLSNMFVKQLIILLRKANGF
jgi:hypothetical protein